MPAPSWTIAIGASGSEGLSDIKALVGALPPSLNAVVMVVLHRPSDRLSNLCAILERSGRMPVVIARQGEPLRPGHCYIGEPDQHLTLAPLTQAGLVEGAGNSHRNKTVDLLFESVAAYGGRQVIGVVLSGSLSDGARGLAAIHAAGGLTMVLQPDPREARGMQRNAIEFDGPVDVIAGSAALAEAILQAVGSERPSARPR